MFAQGQDAPSPAFEVASVKPNKSGDQRSNSSTHGDRHTSINVSLRAMIRSAYQLQNDQLVGGPSWVSSDRFDIAAKADHEFSITELRLMMRQLLSDRFKLVLRSELRELPHYSLVVAQGQKGSRLRPGADSNCIPLKDVPAAGLLDPSRQLVCGGMRIYPGHMNGQQLTMVEVANYLAGQVQRVVVDRTGLKGSFDVDLDFTPDQIPQATLPNGASVDPNGPSIFTAIQEQLGLKLESTKGSIEVLVIDSVAPPTPD
jgi:uncharacterized protein (TIGR03435 family)